MSSIYVSYVVFNNFSMKCSTVEQANNKHKMSGWGLIKQSIDTRGFHFSFFLFIFGKKTSLLEINRPFLKPDFLIYIT
jgi:hypothetical protein